VGATQLASTTLYFSIGQVRERETDLRLEARQESAPGLGGQVAWIMATARDSGPDSAPERALCWRHC
jgi:hypothetical protein